jgi:hypothetical protein
MSPPMGLQVIGSGFGRTGTKSLKEALELLGLGPCHHMVEVRTAPGQLDFWCDIAARKPVDWHAVFADFNSTVDWPSCNYWRELAAAFPDAKIIHTTRPPEQWWNSFSKTIMESMTIQAQVDDPDRLRQRQMTQTIINHDVFGNRISDKAVALAAFRQREAEVRAAIPPERLLILQPSDGWAELCPFLGVPVPAVPYPFTNTTADFRAAVGRPPIVTSE